MNKQEILIALKARLSLDSGLGIGHMAFSRENGRDIALAIHEIRTGKASAASQPRSAIQPVAQQLNRAISTTNAYPVKHEAMSHRSETPEIAISAAPISLVPFTVPPASPEKEAALTELRNQANHCCACGLAEKRGNMVWGEGNPDAALLFIGDAPGRDEDIEGRPFVGRAGRLLTDIIEKGMKIPRNQVYITTIVKCRPPGNRDPKTSEMTACVEYLNQQIAIIEPEIIIAVGEAAGCILLDLPQKSPEMRGRWHEHRGIALRVIHHPSHLLQLRGEKGEKTPADQETWNDVLAIMAKLGTV